MGKKKVKYDSAVKILAKDDYETVRRKFLAYLAKNPDDLKTRIALGNFYFESRNYSDASKEISTVLSELSVKMFKKINSAHKCVDKDNFNGAAENYEYALSYINLDVKARDLLISLYRATDAKAQEKRVKEELNDIENTRFMYNFQLENLRSGMLGKKDAHDILYEFMAPHYSHASAHLYLKEIIKDFKQIDAKILEQDYLADLLTIEDSADSNQDSAKAATNKSSSHHTTKYPPELSIRNRVKFLHELGITGGYVGKDKFTGYYIFEYKKLGISIMEKFYKVNRSNQRVPDYDNATYICPIDMSIPLSKYSKKNVISMMEDMPQIERVQHKKHYYENLNKKIKKVQEACARYQKTKNGQTQADDSEAPEL